MDLAELLAGVRRFNDFSYETMIEKSGISEMRLNRFDNKKEVKLGLDEIQKYADALGLKVEVHVSGLETKWIVPLFKEKADDK